MAIVRICPNCGQDDGPWSGGCACHRNRRSSRQIQEDIAHSRAQRHERQVLKDKQRAEIQTMVQRGECQYTKLSNGYVFDNTYYESFDAMYNAITYDKRLIEALDKYVDVYGTRNKFLHSVHTYYHTHGLITPKQRDAIIRSLTHEGFF